MPEILAPIRRRAEWALRERGIEILMGEQPTAGWRRFDVRDPGRNRVELAERTD